MAKRLVLCCDGTWNVADQVSANGQACPTNVTKLALAVADTGDDGKEQRVFYHAGVGTSRGERLRGGAFGFGLSQNVKDAYRFIVDVFEPGDELFFLGFSRGAFTARSAAGFVRNCGVLRPEHRDRIDEAYALYRSRDPLTRPHGRAAELFRRSYSHETRIRFIGVWDTVGALGIPLSGLRLVNILNRRWQFHDTQLSTTVDAAFQALAIDEHRSPFVPAVWLPQNVPGQRVEQVWFSGVHCDVGGGLPATGLSDIALLWMVDRARSCGLTFRQGEFVAESVPGEAGDDIVVVDPNPLQQPLHDSRTFLYRLLPPLVRAVGTQDPAHEYAASSAITRHDKDPDYAPKALISYLTGAHQVMDVG